MMCRRGDSEIMGWGGGVKLQLTGDSESDALDSLWLWKDGDLRP
jgi:hypothetical protein